MGGCVRNETQACGPRGDGGGRSRPCRAFDVMAGGPDLYPKENVRVLQPRGINQNTSFYLLCCDSYVLIKITDPLAKMLEKPWLNIDEETEAQRATQKPC